VSDEEKKCGARALVRVPYGRSEGLVDGDGRPVYWTCVKPAGHRNDHYVESDDHTEGMAEPLTALEQAYLDGFDAGVISVTATPAPVVDAVRLWGREDEWRMVQEECAELVVAVSHFLRNPTFTATEDLIDEIADAIIVTASARYMAGAAQVDAQVGVKLERLRKRVEAGKVKAEEDAESRFMEEEYQ